MREHSDQVPIIVNDALEDEALSWDNSPIEGKISNYKQSYRIISKFDFYLMSNVFNQNDKLIFCFSEPSKLRKLFGEQNGHISSFIEKDDSSIDSESRSSGLNSITSLSFPYMNGGDGIPNGETFEAYETLGITSDEFEGKLKGC